MGQCLPPTRPLPDDLPPADDWPAHLRDDEDDGRLWRRFVVFGWLFAFCALLEALTACGVIPGPFTGAEQAEMEGE